MARAPGDDLASRHSEEREIEAAFQALDLDDEQRRNLCRRYVAYMDWLESAATRSRRAYYALRLTAGVLAAIVPALVAADLSTTGRVIAATFGVIVAAATAAETFLRLGDRWRHYRVIVELLKAESWLYIQRAGQYRGHEPRAALESFVERMESLIYDEVRDYVSTVVAERAADDQDGRAGLTGASPGLSFAPPATAPGEPDS